MVGMLSLMPASTGKGLKSTRMFNLDRRLLSGG